LIDRVAEPHVVTDIEVHDLAAVIEMQVGPEPAQPFHVR
jgi:hypothetical protein